MRIRSLNKKWKNEKLIKHLICWNLASGEVESLSALQIWSSLSKPIVQFGQKEPSEGLVCSVTHCNVRWFSDRTINTAKQFGLKLRRSGPAWFAFRSDLYLKKLTELEQGLSSDCPQTVKRSFVYNLDDWSDQEWPFCLGELFGQVRLSYVRLNTVHWAPFNKQPSD